MGMVKCHKIFLWAIVFCGLCVPAWAWESDFKTSLKNGGAYIISDKGEVYFSHRASENFIPASTIKIATAACALYHLGKDFRFITEFYLAKDDSLTVKGFGDPFLVSEEFPLIVAGLKKAGLKKVKDIILDTSYFSSDIKIDGASESLNPYDALNGALIANFNTIYVHKAKNGQLISAEKQTPLTPLVKERARKLTNGKQRVNLGQDASLGARYFGELLVAFLQAEGVAVAGEIKIDQVTKGTDLLYKHKSSRNLAEVITDLLEYSTNFTSNQLFLVLGAQVYGAPATTEKGLKVMTEFLKQQIKWQNFSLEEGAGLSHHNLVSPVEMVKLLDYFLPYKDLLPKKFGVFRAKTGTLTGVNTYAGYFSNADELIKFVIFVNDQVPYHYKFDLAKKMYLGITGSLPPESQ